MPYQNVSDDKQGTMESCVQQVMAQGKDKPAAIAICYASVVKGEAFPDGIKFDPDLLDDEEDKPGCKLAIKAVGDWELDVLGVPFGGPENGRDTDGQFFSDKTNIQQDFYPTIPAVYYHGFTPDQQPMGDPEIIGKATYSRKDADGHWWRVALNKSSPMAKRIWDAAKRGTAFASSGSVAHLARLLVDGVKRMYDRAIRGEIINWPVVEMTLIDASGNRQPANQYAVAMPALKTMYDQAGLTLPDNVNQPDGEQPEAYGIGVTTQPGAANKPDGAKTKGVIEMDEKELLALLDARDAAKAAKAAEAAEAASIEALKAENAALKAAARRLPGGGMPAVIHGDRYANSSLADLDFVASVMAGKYAGKKMTRPSDDLVKAMLTRLTSQDTSDTNPRNAMKMAGAPAIKSDEVMQQDLASYGDEWVGAGYGTQLWEAVRQPTSIVGKIPAQEIPQGMETFYDPTEGADPTWYKVAEVTDNNTTTLIPDATVTSSKAGTGRSNQTLAKAGARVLWSGELDEDSLIPMASELRRKMAVSGAEALEYAVIDGDTTTTTQTNINDIGGNTYSNAPSSLFLAVNGLRKLGLVTNTANSRSASGSLTVEDYLETMKLMGTGGGDALDITKCAFIVPLPTLWATMKLAEMKTKDTFSNPTIEGGRVTSLWGYPVLPSAFMHKMQASRLANSAGKIDMNTDGNNLYGSILGVRWDRWKFGWKRRATIETDRIARADAYEIVSLMRFGLKYYSTEASAISYYVGV